MSAEYITTGVLREQGCREERIWEFGERRFKTRSWKAVLHHQAVRKVRNNSMATSMSTLPTYVCTYVGTFIPSISTFKSGQSRPSIQQC
jgi:hypothetical protein